MSLLRGSCPSVVWLLREVFIRLSRAMYAAVDEAKKRGGLVSVDEGRSRRWVKAFEACDEDTKGYLNREDYKMAVVMLFGYKPSKMEVDSAMASVKQSQSGVSLEEFLKLMSAKKPAHFYPSEVRQLFTAFDRQCKGFLSFKDFKKAFSIAAPKLPERIIIEAFSFHGSSPLLQTRSETYRHGFYTPNSGVKGSRACSSSRTNKRTKKPLGKLSEHSFLHKADWEVDQDSDGHISFKEFESAMNYGQDSPSVALPYS